MTRPARLLPLLWVPMFAVAEQIDDAQNQAPAAATAATSESGESFFDVLNNDRLTGDWGGLRTSIEDGGIDFGLSMTTIYQHNAHGGIQTHNGHRITGSVDYELTFDLEMLGVCQGGIIYLLAESDWNDGIGGDRVGNLFGVNFDAAGDDPIFVDEFWFEQSFWEGKARYRIGRLYFPADVDTNAYANDETAQFLNPALVNTGNIPTPDFGLGAQLILQPADWVYLGIVAADAQADGRETGFKTTFHDEDYFFAAVEAGFLPVWQTPRGQLAGAYRFGVWYDPQPKAEFPPRLGGRPTVTPTRRDDVGFFFNMDQVL